MLWLIAALGYMALIHALSSIPGGDAGQLEDAGTFTLYFVPPALQNLFHVPLYAGLAFLWLRTLRECHLPLLAATMAAIAIAAGYGLLDELHQSTVPGRYASVTDVLLNAAGSVCGALLGTRQRLVRPSR